MLFTATGVSVLITGRAYVDVIVRGSELAWAALYMAISFGLMMSAFLAHREVEKLSV